MSNSSGSPRGRSLPGQTHRRNWPVVVYNPSVNSPAGYHPDAGTTGRLLLPQVQVGVRDGMVVRKWNRRATSDDYDLTRRQFRRYVNTFSTTVQLNSGTQKMLRSGYRWPYRGAGWLTPVPPVQPGFQPTFAGYPTRGPDPWTMARLFVQGPGRNPINPGGPATIGAMTYENPMTG